MTVDMSMTAPPMVERVELRMDSQQYVQEAARSERVTRSLIGTIDALAQRLDGLTTRTGRRMQAAGLGITAGAMGAAAVAARYQQQQSPIEASQQMRGETSQIGRIGAEVDRLARGIPVARAELVSLAQTFTDMGETAPRRIAEISEQVTRLSAVTGETIPGLGQAFGGYQRTAGRVQDPSRFMSSLAYVTRERGVSAGGTLQFAESIAPFTRPAGISSRDSIGIAAAFQSAGADGFAAANAFNKVLSDIVRLTQEGSPELAKFSNLIGTTADELAGMDRAEAITRIFEAIGDQGPEAIRTLDKLGLDGVRTAKSIQAVANESGGLRKAITDAGIGANREDLFQDASTEALSGLNDELAKTRNLLEESAKTIGDQFVGGFQGAAAAANTVLTVVNDIVKVLAKPLAVGAGALAVGGMVGGTALAGYKGLGAASGALWAANSTPVRGAIGAFREGRRMGPLGAPEADGYMSRLNAGQIQGWRRGIIERSLGLGTMFTPGDASRSGEDRASRMQRVASQVVRAPVRGMAWWTRGMADMYRVADVAGVDRPSLLRQDQDGPRTTLRQRAAGVAEWSRQMKSQGTDLVKAMAAGDTRKVDELSKNIKSSVEETKKLTTSQGSLRKDLGSLGRAFTGAGFQATRSTLGTVGRMGAGLFSSIGGPMLAAAGGVALYGQMRSAAERNGQMEEWASNPMAVYREELGLATTALGSFRDSLESAKDALPLPKDVGVLTDAEIAYAQATGKPMQPGVSSLGTVGLGAAYLAAYGSGADPGEVQQQRIDVARRLGGEPAREAEQLAAGMTRTEGVRALTEEAINFTGVRDIMTRPGGRTAWPLVGPLNFSEDEKNQLNLATGVISDTRIKETAFGGERAATQAAIPQILTILETLGTEGRQGATDAAVYNLVEQDILPKGFSGKTFMEQFEANRGDVVQAFLGTLDRGGEAGKAEAEKYRMGQYVLSTSEADVEQSMLRFRGEDIGVARYGNLRTSDDTALRDLFMATQGPEQDQTRVEQALAKPGDPALVYSAMQELAGDAINLGGSFGNADDSLQKMQAAIGDVNDDMYQLASAARQVIAAERERAMPTMGRELRLETRASEVERQMAVPLEERGPDWNPQVAYDQFQQESEGYRQFLEGLARAQDNFDVQATRMQEDSATTRARAVEDFTISQQQAWEDYYISRGRAEDQFERSMDRNREDFRISQARSEQDYRVSRARQEDDYRRGRLRAQEDYQRQQVRSQEDFARQMQRSNEDLAKSFYDPFKRAGAQYTYGAGDLLVNLERQNELIAQQVRDVESLKNAGLDQDVIQQLDLLNPNNRQQAGRLAANVQADPSLISQFNQSIEGRLDLAGGITFNTANETYLRAQEDFATAQERASQDFLQAQSRQAEDFARTLARQAEDFTKQVDRAVEDNRRSVARMSEDFRIAADEAEADFQRSVTRSEEAHQRSLDRMAADVARAMARSKEDLIRIAKEYTGSMKELAQRTTEWLSKNLPGMGDALITQINRADERIAALNGVWARFWSDNQKRAEAFQRALNMGLTTEGATNFANSVQRQMDLAAQGQGYVRAGGRNSDGQVGGHLSGGGGSFMKPGTYRYERGPAGHGYNAVDLAADSGTPIYAPWGGSAQSSWDASFGWYTTVTGGGLRFLAAHQARRGVSGTVRTGQQIGVSGSTGNSTGPHVHAEVFRVGTARDAGGSRSGLLNPATYLKYDTGGVLEHGMGAINLSRRPEAILTHDQWGMIDKLGIAMEKARQASVIRDPAELVQAHAARMTTTAPMAAPVINHTVIDQSTAINGAISLYSEDPDDMLRKIGQAKRRRQKVRGGGYSL